MNVFLSILVYLIMAAILVSGVISAVKGSFWLLGIGLLGFVLIITKVSLLRPH